MGALSFLVGRYLLGLRRRTHVAAVSAISFGAMALGTAALVITLALLEGFQATIRAQLQRTGVHAELRPRSGRALPAGEWIEALRRRHPDLEVRTVTAAAVWCTAGGASTPATIEVADTVSRVEVNRVLAARLAVGAGSTLTVASPVLALTPLGPLPRQRRLEVAAVRDVGYGVDEGVVMVPPELAAGLVPAGGPQVVELRAADPAQAWQVASRVHPEVPDDVEVVSFRELNRPLLSALYLERAMIGLGVALVVVVAALNLLCNMALLAAEKRADVALLAALGLPRERIRTLFLGLGLGVGALGGVLGTAFGGTVAWLLDRTHALPLPRGVFIVSHVPFSVTAGAITLAVLVSLVSAALASLLPAAAAARRDILEGLRYE